MKKNYKADRETRKAEVKKYAAQLANGIKSLRTSDGYKKLLRTMAKFPNYSVHNSLMILAQQPDATYVAGYHTWKMLNRHVKKGEKGLRIWAPIKSKIRDEDTQEEKLTLQGFYLTSVFDISQTEGEPLLHPSSFVRKLEGSVENLETMIDAVETATSCTVTYADLPPGTNGYCNARICQIVLSKGLSEAQTLNTLIHEAAHALLHGEECRKSRNDRELEAESVAYIVCRHFGLDTSEKSLGYILNWSNIMDDAELCRQIDTMRKTSLEIIDAMEAAFEE